MNKMSANICNVSELASAISSASGVDTSANALIRNTNSKLDTLIAKQTTQTYNGILKNISGTTYSVSANKCQEFGINCCWSGTIQIQDGAGNTTTFTNGEGINLSFFKGLSNGFTINATGASGVYFYGSCLQ
jgi:hypothetical protein